MTAEEVKNNYEFKVTKKSLMQTFDWIKDVKLENELEVELDSYKSLIFLELVIDPEEVEKEYGWKLQEWVVRALNRGETYDSTSLSVMFEITYDESYDVIEKLRKFIDKIHKSPALPEDLKLEKSLSPLKFTILPKNTSKND